MSGVMTETMRIAVITKPGDIELQQRPVPPVDHDKVLVRVAVCGICGSDLAVWKGNGHKKYPYSPGHEFCGIVEEKGAEAAELKTGQRVVINPNLGCGECSYCQKGKPNLCDRLKTRPVKSNGGLSEYVSLDHRMVHPLPDSIPDELAPYVEPLSCALHAARSVKAEAGEQIAVFGAGIMGILTGLALGPSQCDLIFVEPSEERRAQVKELVDTRVMTPRELTGSESAGRLAAAVDCSGSAEAVAQAITVLRKAGRLVMAGLVVKSEDTVLPLMDVTTKELEIKGVVLNPDTFEEATERVAEYGDVLGKLKTEVFGLEDIEAAFERALARDIHKVLVRP